MTHLRDLWFEQTPPPDADQLGLLRYRSNLLGADQRITNYGGGNTSGKIDVTDPITGTPVRVLAVKGYATPDAIGDATGGSADDATGVLDRLVADGLAEMAAGAFRLTADGRAVAAERIEASGFGIENDLAHIYGPPYGYLPSSSSMARLAS